MNANHLVSNFKNWVVIGDVSNHSKYASKILKKFNDNKYNVSGVHPSGGIDIFKNLSDVPYTIDAIDLCINSIQGLSYIKEAKQLNIKYILIQPGAQSDEILDYCSSNGITAVQGCALVALGNLIL